MATAPRMPTSVRSIVSQIVLRRSATGQADPLADSSASLTISGDSLAARDQ